MARFAVVVVGEDVEQQLRPFRLYESTGEVDAFVQTVDVMEEMRERHESSGGDSSTFADFLEASGLPGLSGLEEPDGSGTHQWGWFRTGPDGQVIEVMRRTNPHGEWDQWEIGVGATGYFPLSDGSRSDRCRWGEVDRDGARAEAQARRDYESWRSQKVPDYSRQLLVSKLLQDYGEEWRKRPECRLLVNSIARVPPDREALTRVSRWHSDRKRYRSSEGLPYTELASPEILQDRFREEYVEWRSLAPFVPYAVVLDGRWVDKGEEGRDLDRNAVQRYRWPLRLAELFGGLSPDQRLTAVLCHI